jgi:hypothetical protein
MSDRDREYRVLGLESNASLDEIEEAYQDLKSVWHPDRFSDSPKLRAKAEEKQKAVERAYQILRDNAADEVTKTSAPEDGDPGRGPSILDDTLSERIGRSKQLLPVWIVLFGLVAVAVVISFLTWSPVDVESEPEPSPTEKILADIREGESTGEEGLEQESQEAGESLEPIEEAPLPSQPSPPPLTRSPDPSVSQPATEPAPRPTRSESSQPTSKPPLKRKPVPSEPVAEITEEVPAEDTSESEAVLEEPAISELAERSFQILRAKSDLANQLIEGSVDEFDYKDWKAVERSASEVYVDLVAEVVSEGREIHFVWAVDVEAQSVKPMSQAARDLEAGDR